MCNLDVPKVKSVQPAIIAAPNNRDSTRQADIEARYRKARSGAAANILTSPLGIPSGSTRQLGGGQ